MDSDRKYRQRGYMDPGRNENKPSGEDRPRHPGPRPPIDVTGPRLPRLVQSITAARCYNCATTLPTGTDFNSKCPKCGADLHCCKQCAHFDSSTRFQCLKPIPVRIAVKDKANECTLFEPRVTVARDASPNSAPAQTNGAVPRSPSDARSAFDALFKNKPLP